jgi:uncharacterized protein YggU (UPF0235/DUF167 family)
VIDLDQHADGVMLLVRAYPGSRQNAVRGEHDGALKIGVTQVAEKGKANKAIVGVLAAELGLKKSQIELLSGQTTSLKRFLVRGVDAKRLHDRINPLLGGPS